MTNKQNQHSTHHDIDSRVVETYALNMIYELDEALASIGKAINQLMELREWLFESTRG